MIICFDVDGTLIDENDQPVMDLVSLATVLAEAGEHVFIWSGGGKDYADLWKRRLGLPDNVVAIAKDKTIGGHTPDIVIDDCEGWGKLQLIVKRGNGPAVLG